MRMPVAHILSGRVLGHPAIGTNPGKTNLSAWWELNESGAATRLDSTANANNLAPTGSPPAVAGVIGNALSLDGSTQRLTDTNTSQLEPGGGAMTIACWVKTSSNNCVILGKLDTPSFQDASYGLALWASAHPTFDCQNGTGGNNSSGNGWVTANEVVNDGAWHLIVAGRAAGNGGCWISVDAGPKKTSPTTANMTAWGWPFTMGCDSRTLSPAFSGAIDLASVWMGRELTGGEITWLYNNGAGHTYSDLA